MVMASREGQPFWTAMPRPTKAAVSPSHLQDRDGCPADTASPTVVERGLLPRVAALDDDPAAVASVTAILSQSGFEVFAFTDAQRLEAASCLAPFAAYVLDWYLGSTTAAALIEGLRRRPDSADAPIFLLSGNLSIGGVPTDQALAQTIACQRVHYRAKPYSGVRLAADLRLALSDRGARPSPASHR